MGITSLLIMLLVGAIAGWLASKIVKGFGFGLLGNIVVGIVGAFLAGLILPQIGPENPSPLTEPRPSPP